MSTSHMADFFKAVGMKKQVQETEFWIVIQSFRFHCWTQMFHVDGSEVAALVVSHWKMDENEGHHVKCEKAVVETL